MIRSMPVSLAARVFLVLVLIALGLSVPPPAGLAQSAENPCTATGSMTTYRSIHTATLLPNGQVLVAGGSYFLPAEIYTPPMNWWSYLPVITH